MYVLVVISVIGFIECGSIRLVFVLVVCEKY